MLLFCPSRNCIGSKRVVEVEVRDQSLQSLIQDFGLKYGHKKKKKEFDLTPKGEPF